MSALFDAIMEGNYTIPGYNSETNEYDNDPALESLISEDPITMYEVANECYTAMVAVDGAMARAENAIALEALSATPERRSELKVAMEGLAGDVWFKLKSLAKRIWAAIKKWAKKAWDKIKQLGDRIKAFFGKYGDVLRNKRCPGLRVVWQKIDLAAGMQQAHELNDLIGKSIDEVNHGYATFKSEWNKSKAEGTIAHTPTPRTNRDMTDYGGQNAHHQGGKLDPHIKRGTDIRKLLNLRVRLIVERAIYGEKVVKTLDEVIKYSAEIKAGASSASVSGTHETSHTTHGGTMGSSRYLDSGRYNESNMENWESIRNEALRIADLGSVNKVVGEFSSIAAREENQTLNYLKEAESEANDKADEGTFGGAKNQYYTFVGGLVRAKMRVWQIGLAAINEAASRYLSQSVAACRKAIWYKGDKVGDTDVEESFQGPNVGNGEYSLENFGVIL